MARIQNEHANGYFTAKFRAEANGRLIPGPPKTEAGRRTVTLPATAAVALAEQLAEFAEPGPEVLVFPAPKGGYLRRSNFRRRWWVRATRAAGVEGGHQLRGLIRQAGGELGRRAGGDS